MSIQALDVEPPKGPVFILGTTFLKKFLAVFDFENDRIGLGLINKSNKKFAFDESDYIVSLDF